MMKTPQTTNPAALSPDHRHNRNDSLSRLDLTEGELYLFHRSDRHCPAIGSLWGVFHKRIGTTIYLKSCSNDLHNFRLCQAVPRHIRCCRPASRAERHAYMRNLSLFESRMNGYPTSLRPIFERLSSRTKR